MRGWIDDIARAVGFLSRLPVHGRHFDGHDGQLTHTVRAFALAGVVIALPSAILAAFFGWIGASPLLAAALVVTAQLVTTGALHEDGLADTADGIGAGAERERALTIMEDSRVGVYGLVALVSVLLLRVAAIAPLIEHLAPASAAAIILATAALSRGAMTWHWHTLPPARTDGLSVKAGPPTASAAKTALATGIALSFVLVSIVLGVAQTIVILAATAAIFAVFTRRTRRRLGGQTGDTIGATQQLCEAAALTAAALMI